MTVQADLCGTLSKTSKTGFLALNNAYYKVSYFGLMHFTRKSIIFRKFPLENSYFPCSQHFAMAKKKKKKKKKILFFKKKKKKKKILFLKKKKKKNIASLFKTWIAKGCHDNICLGLILNKCDIEGGF